MADETGYRLLRDAPVPLRDGTILRADLFLPADDARHPALLCRTPYGKDTDTAELAFAAKAVARGYAVVLQDVRGRHASEGVFDPHVHEGRDGFDSIEWTAAQSWCDGRVGTFGLSYAGCVQWLAGALAPPHLLAMAPAMSYARLRDAIYYGGVFDADWLPWTCIVMAPDTRTRLGLPGARSVAEAAAEWERRKAELQEHLPLAELANLPELTDLAQAAPWYARWLAAPPWSRAWDYADLDQCHPRVTAAVLHLDGWHDDAYGPKAAIAHHQGLCAARQDQAESRSQLVLGPWGHGIRAVTGEEPRGARDFGPGAYLDYDALVLDFMDRHVRGLDTPPPASPVRYFLMGANVWREAESWPPESRPLALHLDAGGRLRPEVPHKEGSTTFRNDPADPVREEEAWALGPEDQRSLAGLAGRLAVFETPPLDATLAIAGHIRAEIWLCADAPDLDLYVKLQDLAPDGCAWPLMDSGAEVLRASLRERGNDAHAGPEPLIPGQAVRLDLDTLLTANAFLPGHRVRVVLCASWHPGMSRNLQTGASEAVSATTRPATITLLHGPAHQSRIVLPVLPVLTGEQG